MCSSDLLGFAWLRVSGFMLLLDGYNLGCGISGNIMVNHSMMGGTQNHQVFKAVSLLVCLRRIKAWPFPAGGFDVTDLANNLLTERLNERMIATRKGAAVMGECVQAFYGGARGTHRSEGGSEL